MFINFVSYVGLFLLADCFLVLATPIPNELFIPFAVSSVLMAALFTGLEAWTTHRRNNAWKELPEFNDERIPF